ncbi:MAG TPA: YhjD/YihY/BrkB family envelope integrity protein [Nocardioides sp.]|uniref:YhjD/YihY/BrkB family envelope integrity protein n=1 Tax=Nocardioides sp. TaxID=35761 RepID=UPI002E378252|nr:YhjD/YihY/BrkB family envelope integrity protein [Nocardioides sp.]HEX5086286.1 YhjD/YihY/BrkB family envelope integrity protein [Nocardioides sp.]
MRRIRGPWLAQLSEVPTRGVSELVERLQGSFVGRCVGRFVRMAGLDRCIVLSSQAFTALIPLLILITTLAPADQSNAAADALIRKFELTGDSAAAVHELFATPAGSTSGVSVSSAVLLLFSGVSFTRRLQTMYRSAWDQEKAGVRGGLFAALGLCALLAEMLVLVAVREFVRTLALYWLWIVPISIATGLVLWTSIPYLLLNRQVHWRRLLAAGGATALGTSLFGLATTVYMAPLVTQYTQEFGLFGITIALIGWLLGAAVVLVSCTVIGAEFDASQGPFFRLVKTRLRLHEPGVELPLDAEGDTDAGLNRDDVVMLLRVLANWSVMAGAVWVATALLPGIDVHGGFFTYLALSLLFGLVNAVLGPLLHLVALPLSVLTVGGAALVVNGVLLLLTAGLTARLDVAGLGSAILGSVVISIVTTVIELVVRPIRDPDDDAAERL